MFCIGVNAMEPLFEMGAQGSRPQREEVATDIALRVLAVSREFGVDLLAQVCSLRCRTGNPVVAALLVQNATTDQQAYTKVVLDERDRSRADPDTKTYIARNQRPDCIVFQVYWPTTSDFTCIALRCFEATEEKET